MCAGVCGCEASYRRGSCPSGASRTSRTSRTSKTSTTSHSFLSFLSFLFRKQALSLCPILGHIGMRSPSLQCGLFLLGFHAVARWSWSTLSRFNCSWYWGPLGATSEQYVVEAWPPSCRVCFRTAVVILSFLSRRFCPFSSSLASTMFNHPRHEKHVALWRQTVAETYWHVCGCNWEKSAEMATPNAAHAFRGQATGRPDLSAGWQIPVGARLVVCSPARLLVPRPLA